MVPAEKKLCSNSGDQPCACLLCRKLHLPGTKPVRSSCRVSHGVSNVLRNVLFVFRLFTLFLWIHRIRARPTFPHRCLMQTEAAETDSTIGTVLLPLSNPTVLDSAIRARPAVDAPGPIRLWHLSSLDAPTVAVVWSLAFAWAAGIRLPLWVPLMLALGTFAVYIGDRVLDARKALGTGNLDQMRERHYFHWKYRRVLLAIAVVAASLAAALIVSLMPLAVRRRDSILAAAALAYFTGVHCGGRNRPLSRFSPSKELLVGMLFTAGCALPALTRMSLDSNPSLVRPFLAAVVQFAALAWLNCYAIETWESEGASRVSPWAGVIAATGLLTALCIGPDGPRPALLLLAGTASALLLLVLDRVRRSFTPIALRAAADLVLLTPVLLASFLGRIP